MFTRKPPWGRDTWNLYNLPSLTSFRRLSCSSSSSFPPSSFFSLVPFAGVGFPPLSRLPTLFPRKLGSTKRGESLPRLSLIMDDPISVNWESLDALVVEFARSERLIEDAHPASPPSSPSSSSYGSRLVNRQIRRSLEAGDVDAAIELLRSHAPFILDDRRILFRLQKQVSRLGLLFRMPGCGSERK